MGVVHLCRIMDFLSITKVASFQQILHLSKTLRSVFVKLGRSMTEIVLHEMHQFMTSQIYKQFSDAFILVIRLAFLMFAQPKNH